ncbi:MAG: membrane dipeptidase [Planctomycetales bacterium]|nr:membrane dipeptidase [Planctomycetales bacterium]
MRNLLIDSHLDLGWNAVSWKRNLHLPLDELNESEANMDDLLGRAAATISFPEMRKGRIGICLATLMGRVPYGGPSQVHGNSLDFPHHDNAYAFAFGHLAYYRVLAAQGMVNLIQDSEQLLQTAKLWLDSADATNLPIGMIVAMEGCDAIVQPDQAEHWFEQGLRVASLVHYGQSRYATGTGLEGPVSTDGKKLLAEFERLGIILDTTHLCDQSFQEALDCFSGPVLASHQNCRSLVAGQRQFPDSQIQTIIDRGGILGIAFDAWMLHPGWQRGKTVAETTPRSVVQIDAAANHIDHICQLAGNCQHVAFGSDLDGGYGTEQTPTGLERISDLQKFDEILTKRGYSSTDIDAIFYGNWLRFFSEHLPN